MGTKRQETACLSLQSMVRSIRGLGDGERGSSNRKSPTPLLWYGAYNIIYGIRSAATKEEDSILVTLRFLTRCV